MVAAVQHTSNLYFGAANDASTMQKPAGAAQGSSSIETCPLRHFLTLSFFLTKQKPPQEVVELHRKVHDLDCKHCHGLEDSRDAIER